MNWFKKAQYTPPPIQIVGWKIYKPETTGTMSISFNGGKAYPYEGISVKEYYYIRSLLGHKNYSTAAQQLKIYEDRQREQQLQPTGYTRKEEQEMLDELEQAGLIGNL